MSSYALRLAGVLIALGLGMLVAHLFSASRPSHGFAESLWLSRQPDLIIQIGLLFVGALGIRALLPEAGDEEDPTDGPMA